MSKSSNDKSANIENSVEENKLVSSDMDALPTRKVSRNLSRQNDKSEVAKENNIQDDEKSKEEVEKKTEEKLEDKADAQTKEKSEEINEHPKDSLKDKLIGSINFSSAPKKVISNIKYVAKNNKISYTCIGIAILIAILVIMIFLVFSKDEKDNSMARYLDDMRTQEVVQSDIEQVNYFFTTYYDALATGNTTIVEGLFDDPSKANITTEISEIVEKFDNISVYVTKGINDEEVVAFVYNELKFPNIETTAPCVDTFYLIYNSLDNSLKIDTSMYTDSSIIEFINVVAKKEPVRSLLSNTNENLNQALDSDGQLKDLYLIMQSMTDNAEGTTEAP